MLHPFGSALRKCNELQKLSSIMLEAIRLRRETIGLLKMTFTVR